ncbi:hypothetical protein C8R46DRAFT_1042963 [Mycena filopes]|nr:hypothetical protein C8R46DRAFT_1042963 [Mycena filopes]
MPPQFLDLPPELILSCLANLPRVDIDSCVKCGNRLLHGIIASSVLLRYLREQELAGVEENPSLPWALGISERLAKLKERETAWQNFSGLSTHSIALDFVPTGIYELGSDIFLVGNPADPLTRMSTGVKYVNTSPASNSTPSEWGEVKADKPVIDFGTALEEHDLLAMVTYTPYDTDPQMASVDVMLFSLSTGAPHPLAANPTLHIQDVQVDHGHPYTSLEISGTTLALSLLYWDYDERDCDTLHIYNWTSGEARMEPYGVYNTGLIFLREDLLIVPDTLGAQLDILYIPPADDDLPQFVQSCLLPAMKPDTIIHDIQCRGAPNPRAALRRTSRAPFLPRPSDAIILLGLQVASETDIANHILVIHRPTLLRLLDAAAPPEGKGLEWAAWGPQCTRWLDARDVSMRYITTTVGQRLVTIGRDAPDVPAPIRVLNFNSRDVEAQRGSGAPDGPHATVRVVEAGTLTPEGFEEPIVSLIPFVETCSRELFDYGAVLINDENILGARFGERNVESIVVHHIG